MYYIFKTQNIETAQTHEKKNTKRSHYDNCFYCRTQKWSIIWVLVSFDQERERDRQHENHILRYFFGSFLNLLNIFIFFYFSIRINCIFICLSFSLHFLFIECFIFLCVTHSVEMKSSKKKLCVCFHSF